jgi:hypothetical protein
MYLFKIQNRLDLFKCVLILVLLIVVFNRFYQFKYINRDSQSIHVNKTEAKSSQSKISI